MPISNPPSNLAKEREDGTQNFCTRIIYSHDITNRKARLTQGFADSKNMQDEQGSNRSEHILSILLFTNG